MQRIMRVGKEGSITVYMTLTLAVLLSLFLMLIEGARERAVELVAGCAVDLAVYSVFAEYNRELFDAYDLLFVDTSYGTDDSSGALLKSRLEAYIEENLSAGNTAKGIAKDLTQTFLEDVTIEKCSYATDEGGTLFLRQAVAFMKQEYGVSYLEHLKRELQKADETELFTKDVAPEREANEGILKKAKEEGIETGETDEEDQPVKKKAEFDNPADTVNGARSLGVLSLVAGDKTFSESAVRQETLLSERGIDREGDGLCGRDGAGAGDKLWFTLYIREHCGCFLSPKETGVLQYQTEYIIGGKMNDIDNLKAVVTRLLLLRETANVVYLFSDAAKQAEAEMLAASIATAAGFPILTEPLKLSLLFAWAYAESLWDVRTLLSGGSVRLIKTAEEWHYSLAGMAGAASDSAPPVEEPRESTAARLASGKLGYEEYLLLFLSLAGKQTLIDRMMDIAEMDVRKNSPDFGFCLTDCCEYLLIEADVAGRRGGGKTVRREFSYD